MKALLVEDDDEVAGALIEGLRQYGWTVDHVSTGAAALQRGSWGDIVLLGCRVPIIAVTARSDEMDKVLGLRLGADDYIVKPYRLQELLARMAAVLRRTRPEPAAEPTPVLVSGRLTIDREQRTALLDGRPVPLTRKEFELLLLLAGSPNRVFPREQLLDAVWDQQWVGNSRTLDTHVAALRRKLGSTRWIRTTRGVGFSFEPQSPG
ncbi:response regulator transcription factor [Streptomyces sp. NPDC018031]|uniref:response regulator transcription factor n=1 Tax=Streptomyces sp. NPDC018031 TaxID=3365033 RepID=UPI0037AFC86F